MWKMKSSIVNWIRKICLKNKLSAYYYPPNDSYIIHYKGKVVTAFYGKEFYDLSPTVREKGIKGNFFGLSHNLGEMYHNQLLSNYKNGKHII